ncbi:MAG TPA: sortase [Candidatus Woesebacteria bacterium]|nr:sortase [Candidatus Woesebacteria bacterium]
MRKLWSAYLDWNYALWSRWLQSARSISWTFIALAFFSYSFTHWRDRLSSYQLDQAVTQTTQSLQSPFVDQQPAHIRIGNLVDISVGLGHYRDGSWTNNLNQAVYWTGSALPGQGGNIIIYGHNTHNVFGNMLRLVGNEQITATLKSGQKREYQIVEMIEVNPSDTQVLEPRTAETLILYTCSGLFDTRRFVVLAEPTSAYQFCFADSL